MPIAYACRQTNTFWALLFHKKPSYMFNNAACTFLYMLGIYPSFFLFLFPRNGYTTVEHVSLK